MKFIRRLKKQKKGVLFTITTIFLLLGVFLLCSAYLARNKELQRTATLSLSGSRINFIEDDVLNDIYPDLISTDIISISRGNNVTIIFNHSDLNSTINHSHLMQEYKDFIEGVYSSLNNIDVDLDGFNNSFTFSPYNSTFIVEGNIIYVYIDDLNSINKTKLTIIVDGTDINISDGKPGSNGDIGVEVNITHTGGEFISSANLDPAISNNPFYVNFNSSSRIEVNFGQYNSKDGVLRINASGLKADIPKLELVYNLIAEKVVVKGGNISMISAVSNITKDTEIIIWDE